MMSGTQDSSGPHVAKGVPDQPESAAVESHAVEDATETPVEAPTEPAKTASNPARKIVLVALLVLIVFYIYDVVADRVTPYTSQATVDTFLIQVAPEVTGRVEYVGVADNTRVKQGQVLFRIERDPFEIALQAARANLASALQAAGAAAADVAVADAQLRKQRVDLAASRALAGIVTGLVAEGALPETNAIRARADVAKTESDVVRSEAELDRARQRLGDSGYRNASVRQALAAIRQSELDLKNTIVTAPADGVVTNLRLAPGQFASGGQPLLSFIKDGPRWISAAMRENQLGNVAPGNHVLVVLDQSPGAVYKGRVESIGWGISQGDEAPTGQLASVEPATGWIREPQRFPLRIRLLPEDDREALMFGRSGAQANVVVFTDEDSILNPLGRLWIRIVSWLSYLQ